MVTLLCNYKIMLDKNNQILEMLVFLEAMLAWTLFSIMIMLEKNS